MMNSRWSLNRRRSRRAPVALASNMNARTIDVRRLFHRLALRAAVLARSCQARAPLVKALNGLCNFIDAKSPGVIPTVLLPDGDGHFRLAAGPKVPQNWNEAFESMRLRSYASFHSMPGLQEKFVPVADMRGDPRLQPCWDLTCH